MFEFITDIFQSLSIFEIGAIILVIGVTIFFIYYNVGSKSNDLLIKMTPLHIKKDIATPDVVNTTLLGSGSSTVVGFFNIQQGNRTSNLNNDFIPLLFVDNNWWLEIAHAPNGERSAARLRIQTSDGTYKMEQFDLPSIPKQKWICIAILREGRRFDVIYNNRIVASHRCEAYPVVINSALSIGNPMIAGKCIHVIINPTRLSPDEVERLRLSHVDTNGAIIEDISIVASLPTLRLTVECPPGLPCDTITQPPNNKMMEWTSPYA